MYNCIYWTCWDVESVLINDGLIGGGGQRHSETLRTSRKVSVIVTLHIQYEFQAILKMDLWFVKHFPLVYLCLFENLLLTNYVKRLLFKTKRQKKKKKNWDPKPTFYNFFIYRLEKNLFSQLCLRGVLFQPEFRSLRPWECCGTFRQCTDWGPWRWSFHWSKAIETNF